MVQFSEIVLQKLEPDTMVPPLSYNGHKITRKECMVKLHGKTRKKRGQVEGLVYCPDQMPVDKHNLNGWKYAYFADTVSLCPTTFVLHDVEGNKKDVIHVHTTLATVSNHIRACEDHCLANHTHVRNDIKHETGTMVSSGHRVEIKSSTVNMYRPGRNNTPKTREDTPSLYNYAATDFRTFLMKSPLKDVYEKDINKLKTGYTNNCWKVQNYRNKNDEYLYLHPSSSMSMNLTNSMHIDPNDGCRSTAIWWTSSNQEHLAVTFLLFPYYGLAIECGSKTTIVNWDGSAQYHCSCTMPSSGHVFSFFNCAYKDVIRRNAILRKMFDKKKTGKNKILAKRKIYVRIRQRDLNNYGLQRQDYGLHPTKYSLLRAEVVCLNDEKDPYITFDNSRLSDRVLSIPVPRRNCVCVDFVNEELESWCLRI